MQSSTKLIDEYVAIDRAANELRFHDANIMCVMCVLLYTYVHVCINGDLKKSVSSETRLMIQERKRSVYIRYDLLLFIDHPRLSLRNRAASTHMYVRLIHVGRFQATEITKSVLKV